MTKARGIKAAAMACVMTLSFAACEEEKPPIETVGTTTTAATTETPVQEVRAADFEYSEIDGEIRIDKYVGQDTAVVIPAVIDGKPVTVIGDTAFQANETLESVTIPDSVEVIGGRSFQTCWALKSVTLPDHAVKIGGDSFSSTPWFDKTEEENAGNTFLILNGTLLSGGEGSGDVTIPDGVQWIADNAFYYRALLTSVTIPDSVTEIGDSAFRYCRNLTRITIPDSVTRVGGYAFAECEQLADATLGGGVTEIGEYAFRGCEQLTRIAIPDGLTMIGDRAFSGCGLTSVTIPDSVTRIGNGAFSGCGLTSVTIPDGVTGIGAYAFSDCGALKSVTLPDGLESLGKGAFNGGMTVTYRGKEYGFPALRDELYNAVNGETPVRETDAADFEYSEIDGGIRIDEYVGQDTAVVIPAVIDGKPVTALGGETGGPFRDNTAVESVVIPEGVTEVGACAFYGCKNLERITIPESVERIGTTAFGETPWLAFRQAEDPLVIVNGVLVDGRLCASESVTIPDGVKRIAGLAFSDLHSGCKTLTSVEIPDSVETIGAYAFARCPALENAVFPNHAVEMEQEVFLGTPWLDKMREENPLVIVNGSLIDGQTCSGDVTIPDGVRSIAKCAFFGSSITSVTIPDSVTGIGDYALSGCRNLTSVTIPESVEVIGDHAFYACGSLTSVTIPDSVTEIGDYAFYDCYDLTSVTIPDSVTEIGDNVFRNCDSLTSVTIPDSVTVIGDYAFSDCGALKSVTLPDGLESLGKGVFNGGMTVAYRGKEYGFPALRDELYHAVNGAE